MAITNDGQKIVVSNFYLDDPFLFSEDFGSTWVSIPPPVKENTDYPGFTHVFSNSGNRIVSRENEYSIWTTDDFGQTWIKRLQGLGQE